ncbi:MAG: hypothetical protein JWM51_2061 [Microbacteriaceae bacterium]|nr:hypothetical protein [Microbacteriaceae bacterium]
MRFIDFSGTSTPQLRVIRVVGGLAVLLWVGFLVISVARGLATWQAFLGVVVVGMGAVIVGVQAELRRRARGDGTARR